VPTLPPTNVGLIGALHEEMRKVVGSPSARGRASIESNPATGFSTAVKESATAGKTLR
jgi:hypothetical protein